MSRQGSRASRGGLLLALGVVILLTGCVRAGGAEVSATQPPSDPNEAVAAASSLPVLDPTQLPAPSVDSVIASPALPFLTADQFWIAAQGGDPEVITYASLGSLIKDSSAVVVGSISSITKGPDYLTKEGVYTVYQASVHVKIDRVLSGSVKSPTPDQVTFVQAMGVDNTAMSNAYADVFAQFAGSIPKEQVILFLVNLEDCRVRLRARCHCGRRPRTSRRPSGCAARRRR